MEEKQSQLGFMATFARAWRRPPAAPEGLAASGVSLGEIARLPSDEALGRVHGGAEGLTPDEADARLRSVGPNQIAHQVRHTIIGELFSRSINPLNLLLLTLAAASFPRRRRTGEGRRQPGAALLAGA